VALPGRPEQPVQVVDSRDLAGLVTRLLVDDHPGAFNAIGPAEPTTLSELIHTCARIAGTTVELVPVPERVAGSLFPLVRPESVWTSEQRSSARARAAGMPATPLEVTAADARAWDLARGEPPIPRGFTPEQEEQILQEYGQQKG
jgi:2'-hydroxyisoflavone reductase